MSKFTPTKNPSEVDWARLAAFIDGEGCVRISHLKRKDKNKYTMWMEVVICNTDPRLIQWLVNTFGIGRVASMSHQNVKWATSFRWHTSCRQAEWVLENCLPFFVIKREQAEIALAFQATLQRVGVKGHSDEVWNKRWALKSSLSSVKGTSSRRELTDILRDKQMSETVN